MCSVVTLTLFISGRGITTIKEKKTSTYKKQTKKKKLWVFWCLSSQLLYYYNNNYYCRVIRINCTFTCGRQAPVYNNERYNFILCASVIDPPAGEKPGRCHMSEVALPTPVFFANLPIFGQPGWYLYSVISYRCLSQTGHNWLAGFSVKNKWSENTVI